MNEGRWVLLIASEVGRTDSVSDRAMERLVDAIGEEGYEVVRTSTPEDGLSLVTSDPSYSAILLDWDLEGDEQFDERAALEIMRAVRHRNKKSPDLPHRRPHARLRASARSRQAGPRVHPPLRRHPGLHRQSRRLRRRALPRAAAAALLPRAQEVHRPGRLLLGRARPHGRRRVSSSIPSGRSSTASSAKTSCAPTSASRPRRWAPGSITSGPRATPNATPRASSARTGPSTCSAAPAPPTRSSATASSRRTTSCSPTPTATSPSATRSPSPARAPSTSSPRATATA